MEQNDIRLSRRVLIKHQKELKKLNNFCSEIKKELIDKIISIILIGSRARQDFNIGSDIDLIIVGHWKEDILFERINELEQKIEIPSLPIDFFLYRPDEINKLVEKANPLILDGFTEGIYLYNKDYYDKIQRKIKKQISQGKLSKKENLWKLE